MEEDILQCKYCSKFDVYLNFEGYEYVCHSCGSVHAVAIGCSAHEYFKDNYNWSMGNFYQAKFHFNERMSQWCCNEPLIPDPDVKIIMDACAKYEKDGKSVDSKRDIQRILRSLGRKFSKKYLEKWLSILRKYNKKIYFPCPSNRLVDCLRSNFNCVLGPFENSKPKNRKHLPNYNYIIRQLLYIIDPELDTIYSFCFPLLQSKKKVENLDELWLPVCQYNGWEYRQMSKMNTSELS